MRIAVVGGGIAGNAAAWALDRAGHEVVVYEKNDYPGGHSATVDIDHGGVEITVDTGFIVYNELNYPEMTALYRLLDVPTELSEMTFSVSIDRGRREWAGNTMRSVFAQKRNMVSPTFLWMLREILRFNSQCLSDRDAGHLSGLSLGDYLTWRKFSQRFLTDYLVPMGAAIWSTPVDHMLAFPAESFVNFFANHRLINWRRPEWRTVSGGSREYVRRLTAPIGDRYRLASPVARIERDASGVTVIDDKGHRDRFDQVVIGAHSDEALAMLSAPTQAEDMLLGAIRYRPNRVFLHRDRALMPRRKGVWSSWNYLSWSSDETGETDVSVTYWMNALQNLDPSRDVFVSLNPPQDPDPDLTFGLYSYAHPQFDQAAMAAQKDLVSIQGENRTWFCGAYCGYGFHEDGLRAGIDVAERLGADIPWQRPGAPATGTLLDAAE